MNVENSGSESDVEACAALRRLVEGTNEPLVEGTVTNAIRHWTNCRSCQDVCPNALRTLNAIQEELEKEIRNGFVKLRHQFLSRKHRLLSDSSSTDTCPYDEIIAAQFSYGSDIQFDLGFIHHFGGLAEFSLFPVSKDSEEWGAWEASAPFLRSLDGDTQHFVFTSLLSYDLLISSYRLVKQKTYESQATDSLSASETEDKLNEDFVLCLSQSAIQTSVLYDMLEKSSSWYRDDYFTKNPPKPIAAASTTDEVTTEERQRIDMVLQGFRELKQEVEDLGDSLKAAQNYLISELARHQQRAGEFDAFLRSELGDEVYGQLRFDTRRSLHFGEYHYQQNKEPDGYNPSVLHYCGAYEMEFNARITEPVVAELIKSGRRDYPPNSPRQYAILVQGKVHHIAVGSAARQLRADPLLRQIVHSLRLDVDDVTAGAAKLSALRNRFAHNNLADKAYADRVRQLMLGSASVLKDLIPHSIEK